MEIKRHIDDEQPATVQEHFDLLMTDESHLDESTADKIMFQDLPEWYNEDLFKAGQNYCRRNRFGICSANLLGVLVAIVDPYTVEVMASTKQSKTPCTAFRRLLRTMLHSEIMKLEDINNPESSWWKSLNVIRWKHAIISERSDKFGPGKILNRELAVAQFNFLGYILIMPDKFGLTNEAQEREGFNHLWKVIGHLLGIPDKLNICRKNEAETTELCQKIKDEIVVKNMENQPEKFKLIADRYLESAWYINPTVDADSIMYFWYNISGLEYKKPLGFLSRLNYKFIQKFTTFFGVPIVGDVLRFLTNYYLEICLWSATNFNVLAWLRFGKSNTKINLHLCPRKIENTTPNC